MQRFSCSFIRRLRIFTSCSSSSLPKTFPSTFLRPVSTFPPPPSSSLLRHSSTFSRPFLPMPKTTFTAASSTFVLPPLPPLASYELPMLLIVVFSYRSWFSGKNFLRFHDHLYYSTIHLLNGGLDWRDNASKTVLKEFLKPNPKLPAADTKRLANTALHFLTFGRNVGCHFKEASDRMCREAEEKGEAGSVKPLTSKIVGETLYEIWPEFSDILLRSLDQCGFTMSVTLPPPSKGLSKISGEIRVSVSASNASNASDVVSMLGRLKELKMGKILHASIEVEGLTENISVMNALIDMYVSCGRMAEAVRLFKQMVQSGVEPNEDTFTSTLHACSHFGLVDEGLYLFEYMLKNPKISPCHGHCTCIIDLLGRAGRLDEAYILIRKTSM